MRAIFTYHSIDDSGSPISVDRTTFRRHVEWFASGRVRVVSLDRIMSAALGSVAITFDDGFRNFATEALPLLEANGLEATLFVVSDHVGGRNGWGGHSAPGIPELPLLAWDELARVAASGVAIGSHTRRHPRLPSLDDASLDDELGESAARIERHLSARPKWLAYPYGAVNREVRHRASRYYEGAVTTEYRTVTAHEDPLAIPRLDAFYFRRPGALERWGSSDFRRSIWFRRQARRARAVLDRLRPKGAR